MSNAINEMLRGRRDDARYAEDVAALMHFSAYIAREARRLGLNETADKAIGIETELLSVLGDR